MGQVVLVITGLDFEEAKKIVEKLDVDAVIWDKRDFDIFNSGYLFAVLTHGHKKAGEPLFQKERVSKFREECLESRLAPNLS